MPLENRIQDVVNSLEQGLGMSVMRIFVFACLMLAIFGVYAVSQFRGLVEPGAMEQAQLARRLAAGQGFTTQCLRPSDIGCLAQAHRGAACTGPLPDIRHAPLYPALLALGFKIARPPFEVAAHAPWFPPETRVIVPLGIALSVATGLLILLAGRRLFSAQVGFIAMLAYYVTDAVLADSLSGSSRPLLAFLTAGAFTTAMEAVLRLNEDRPWHHWLPLFLASTLFCALAVLTGYAMAVLIPCVAALLAYGARRWGSAGMAILLLVVALAVLPWLWRNQRVSGHWLGTAPQAALNQSVLYPAADGLDRTRDPQLHNFPVVLALKIKLLANLERLYDGDLRTLGSGFAICFFLVSLFSRFEREEANVMRWCVALGLLLLVIVAALGGGEDAGRLRAMLPLVVLFATAFLFAVLERTYFLDAAAPLILPWVFVILAALPAVGRVAASRPASPYPPCFPPFIAYACHLLDARENLCTDIPWATAWYGRRTSLLLPPTPEDFRAIDAAGLKLSALYLTTRTSDRPYASELAAGSDRAWLPLLNRQIPAGFPLMHGIDFPAGTRDQLFLTDRVRWKQTPPSGLAEGGTNAVAIRPADRDASSR